MSRVVYAAQLRTDAEDITSVLEEYNNWVGQFYLRNYKTRAIEPFGGSVDGLPDGHSIQLASASKDGAEVYDLDWSYVSEDDDNLVWRNLVRVAMFGGSCLFEHRVQIEAREFIIRPTPIMVGAPAVVRRLCKRGVVKFGTLALGAAPYFLSEKNIEEFLNLLRSPERRIPIVLVTPYAGGGNPDIDSDELANALAGVAIVVEAVNQDTTWELRAELGKDLACFDGGIRIYWPGFTDSDRRERHPLFLGQWVRGRSDAATTIERLVFSVAAEKFVPDHAAEELVQAAARADRRSDLPTNSDSAEWKQIAETYLRALEAAEQRIRELQTQVQNAKVLYVPAAEVADEPPSEGDSDDPATVADAVRNAEGKCKALIFTESARRSAADSPFMRPREVQDALELLDKVTGEWQARRRKGEPGGDVRRMLMDRGIGKRCSMHISDTTRNRYESDYTFLVDGAPTLVEPHITLGSGDAGKCASIHFQPPTDKRATVVVHVGRHLPNTKS